MTGLDYLDFFGKLYRLPKNLRQERGQMLMERFGLGMALDKRLGEYSKGMKQKLALVRAMLHDPPVLLLDEPTSAMDPQSAKQVRDSIRELRSDRRTVVITTHNLTEAYTLADRRGRWPDGGEHGARVPLPHATGEVLRHASGCRGSRVVPVQRGCVVDHRRHHRRGWG
jgi:ABC-type multidrug transport system ATPase subunit